MKKTLIVLLSIAILLSFTACNPTTNVSGISNDDLELAKSVYKAVVNEISNAPTTSKTDGTVSDVNGYNVSYDYTYTSETEWEVSIEVTANGAESVYMQFSVKSDSAETIAVTIGASVYNVSAESITNNIGINFGTSDDPEESVDTDEEEKNPSSGDNEGTDHMDPVNP